MRLASSRRSCLICVSMCLEAASVSSSVSTGALQHAIVGGTDWALCSAWLGRALKMRIRGCHRKAAVRFKSVSHPSITLLSNIWSRCYHKYPQTLSQSRHNHGGPRSGVGPRQRALHLVQHKSIAVFYPLSDSSRIIEPIIARSNQSRPSEDQDPKTENGLAICLNLLVKINNLPHL